MVMYIIIELPTLCIFHDDKNIVGSIQYLIKFDDIFVIDEFQYFDLSFDLHVGGNTLEIMFLFFILRLFMILTATLTPVRSCLASRSTEMYI